MMETLARSDIYRSRSNDGLLAEAVSAREHTVRVSREKSKSYQKSNIMYKTVLCFDEHTHTHTHTHTQLSIYISLYLYLYVVILL